MLCLTFHRSQNSEKVIAQQSRFAASEADLLCRLINKRNGGQYIIDNPTVVDVFGRLRTHEAVVVASFGKKKVIMKRATPVKDPYLVFSGP